MKIENQVCTVEQAKRLSELGIKMNSFLYWKKSCLIKNIDKWIIINSEDSNINEKEDYSAYSVSELDSMLPSTIDDIKLTQWKIQDNNFGIQYRYMMEEPIKYKTFPDRSIFADTEAKVRAELLILIIENKYVTAEECNTRLLNS